MGRGSVVSDGFTERRSRPRLRETSVLYCFFFVFLPSCHSHLCKDGLRGLSQMPREALRTVAVTESRGRSCRRLKGNRPVLEPMCDKDEAIVHSSSPVSIRICFPWSAVNTLHYSPLCVLGATYTSAFFCPTLLMIACVPVPRFSYNLFCHHMSAAWLGSFALANSNFERAVLLVHASCRCLP